MIIGIIMLLVTGLTWTFSGIAMSGAPRHKVDSCVVQFVTAVVIILAGSIRLLCTGALENVPHEAIMNVMWCCLGSGLINFYMMELMSYAMQIGPNGIIWAITQSGILGPFTMGILFFGVPLTLVRVLGIVLIIAALMLFGMYQGKKSEPTAAAAEPTASTPAVPVHNRWLLYAFICFAITAVQQSVNNVPSYYEDMSCVPGEFRSGMNAVGILISAFLYNAVRRRNVLMIVGRQLTSRALWGYVVLTQFFGLLTSWFLFYKGLDLMRAEGCGSAGYPIVVVSCIVGFFLYSCLWMHEHAKPLQYLALLMCIVGIVAIVV